MLKTGLNGPLMREIFDELDECEERMSRLLIDLANDESETNSPNKMTHQESNEEVVYLSRTQKETMRSYMMIVKISDMKTKLGSKVKLRKTANEKEPRTKTAISAKRKRVEVAADKSQGDGRVPGTTKTMIDVAMVAPIVMAVLRSASSYKTRRSDRSHTGAASEIEILSQ